MPQESKIQNINILAQIEDLSLWDLYIIAQGDITEIEEIVNRTNNTLFNDLTFDDIKDEIKD